MAEFDLKKALAAVASRRTQEQIDAQNTLNETGRARLDPNSAPNRLARAKQFEQHALEQLDYVRTLPDGEVKTNRINALMDRLGELAAEQGDYNRAAKISFTPKRREHYTSVVKAIKISDDKTCNCPPDMVVDRKKGIELRSSAMMPMERIVGTNGELLTLHQCRKCGFRNTK